MNKLINYKKNKEHIINKLINNKKKKEHIIKNE